MIWIEAAMGMQPPAWQFQTRHDPEEYHLPTADQRWCNMWVSDMAGKKTGKEKKGSE